MVVPSSPDLKARELPKIPIIAQHEEKRCEGNDVTPTHANYPHHQHHHHPNLILNGSPSHVLPTASTASAASTQQNNQIDQQDLRLPLQFIVREHAKSLIAIKELQHEVSSLLVLKDALLETFPHLHQRITGIPQDGRRLGVHKSGDGGDISDDITTSWTHTGSMPRHRKIRKSPEGSSTGSTVADSGFSTEKEKEISVITSSHTHSNPHSSSSHPQSSPPQGVPSSGPGPGSGPKGTPPDVRWDGWTTMSRWPTGGPGPPQTLAGGPPPPLADAGDELMSLLEIIHRKAVKLRSQEEERSDSRKSSSGSLGTSRIPSANNTTSNQSNTGTPTTASHQLGAIFEGSELNGDHRNRRRLSAEDLASTADKLGVSADKDVLMDKILKLENETIRSRSQVARLEGEIARVSRQKELLEDQLRSAGLKEKDDHSLRANSEGPGGIIHSVQILTGTGDSRKDGTPESARILSQSESNLRGPIGEGSVNIEIRSQQDNNAKTIGGAKSTEVLNRPSSHLHPSRGFYRQFSGNGGMNPSVSVVNLRSTDSSSPVGRLLPGGSVDDMNPRRGNLTPEGRYFQNRVTGPPNLSSGRNSAAALAMTAPQLKRVLSNEMLAPKSRSVENLYEGRMIRSSNSEISLQPRALYPDGGPLGGASAGGHHTNPRMKGTKSEQVLTKIGKLEKIRLSESVVSMPAELARNQRNLVVKPNRERFRQILSTSSTLELQRQLLTSVMENEVYKSQLSKITETWHEKIQDFEKVNNSLLNNLERLRGDNEQLKLQMEAKNIELEGTKARLRQLEQSADVPHHPPSRAATDSPAPLPQSGRLSAMDKSKSNTPEPDNSSHQRSAGGGHPDVQSNLRRLSRSHSRSNIDLSSRIAADNYIKYPALAEAETVRNTNSGGAEQRVTFDLGPKKARMAEVSVAKRALQIDRQSAVGNITASQLPSDARARLQELAGNGGGDIKRNYRKSSNHSADQPIRPNKLSVNNGVMMTSNKYMVSPPGTPTRTTPGTPTRTTSPDGHVTSKLSRRDSYRAGGAINSAKNSLIMNLQNNNVKKASTLSSPNIRRGSRTRTPSIERSLTSGGNGHRDDKDSTGKDSNPSSQTNQLQSPLTPSHSLLQHQFSQSPRGGLGSPAGGSGRLGSPGGRLLPAPPVLESKGLPATLTSMDIKHLKHDTIAELIAGILQKCAKNEEMKTNSPRPYSNTNDDTESEGSSIRPQTAMRLVQPPATVQPASRTSRSSSNPSIPPSSMNRTLSQANSSNPRSWEAFNQTEEITHNSHTATRQSSSSQVAVSPPPLPHYDILEGEEAREDSLPLPDSLNEFEGEEYQANSSGVSVNNNSNHQQYVNQDHHVHLDPDSLTSRQSNQEAHIDQHNNNPKHITSPTPSPDSLNPDDDLNRHVVSPSPKFFDSITLMDENMAAITVSGGRQQQPPLRRQAESPKLRRIIPFADNSLSSGNSVFTSQDASLEDSKPSSSSSSVNKQVHHDVHEPIYSNVTLNMRPILHHPLEFQSQLPSSRHHLKHVATTNRFSPSPGGNIVSPGLENSSRSGSVINQPNQTKDKVMTSSQQSAVETGSAVLQQQTSPVQQMNSPTLKSGISLTEKLKWKFLGW